jgi:hypothetical protein
MAEALPQDAVVAVIGAGAMGSVSRRLPRYMGTVSSCTTRFGAGDEARRTSAKISRGKWPSQAIGDGRGGDAATDHHGGDTSTPVLPR